MPILLALNLPGCSREGASEPIASPPQSTHAWQTICIDRLLIDVPGDIEMASAPIAFREPYQIDDLADRASRGSRWKGIDLRETGVTNEAGLQLLREGGARAHAFDEHANRDSITAARAQIARWEENVRNPRDEGEKKISQELVDEGKSRLANATQAIKVSGESTHMPPNSFAYRRGDAYTVGYLDKADRRVRTFEGALASSVGRTPEAAADALRGLHGLYRARQPIEIPQGAGYCSPLGFFSEAAGADVNANTEIMFRSRHYPNLIFTLDVQPSSESKSIQAQPNMAARDALLDMFHVKRSFGPVAVQMLGTPGRLVGQEYKPENCFAPNPCRPPDQAYEFEAETYGEPGNLGRPGVVLSMQAALSDDYKSKLTTLPGNEKALEIRRGSLKGVVPPDTREGRAIFERVLHSIRLRPGAVAGANGN